MTLTPATTLVLVAIALGLSVGMLAGNPWQRRRGAVWGRMLRDVRPQPSNTSGTFQMTWLSYRAQRRIKVAHRLQQWAQQAETRGKHDRAARLREMSAHYARVAYSIEEGHRKHVPALNQTGAA